MLNAVLFDLDNTLVVGDHEPDDLTGTSAASMRARLLDTMLNSNGSAC
jgi:hypothetical protein